MDSDPVEDGDHAKASQSTRRFSENNASTKPVAEEDQVSAEGMTEASPLLANVENGLSQSDSEGGNEFQKWEGDKDFEGLPWWKMPSVSMHHISPGDLF